MNLTAGVPTFKNKDIEFQVFTHRSYLNESNQARESNERMEFLGDSILSFVVSSYIYEKYPQLKEGELTNLRSILTNTETLYEISKALKLGDYLKLSKGEEASGGRTNKSLLANTYESVVGGLYLDQGIEASRKFIHDTIITQIDVIIEDQGLKDPKSNLQEVLQERYKDSPIYEIVEEDGPDHDRTYTVQVRIANRVLGKGIGKSKQDAEKQAAKEALFTLK
jgi:ribonuclease-3